MTSSSSSSWRAATTSRSVCTRTFTAARPPRRAGAARRSLAFEQPEPVLELRHPELELVPLLAGDEAELAREILDAPPRALADADRVTAPARRELVAERAQLVEPP